MTMTNIEVEPSVALGLLVAQTDFELEIGRLFYDGQDGVVWFEMDLLGNGFSDEDPFFALRFVAEGAAEFSGRIRNLFGGSVITGRRAGRPVKGKAGGQRLPVSPSSPAVRDDGAVPLGIQGL